MNLVLLDTLFALVKMLYFLSAWEVATSSVAMISKRQYILPILALCVLLVLDRYVP
jgi:hypothetical protein